MLISQELTDAINAQIGREFGASMQYLEIAAYFDAEALNKTAEFFYKQSEEEREHALKLLKYVVETGGQVRIPVIESPKPDFHSAEEAFEASLAWEQEVTRQINNLMAIAVRENDYLSRQFLDWFVVEQLEEVNSMDQLLRTVRRLTEKNIILLEPIIAGGH